MSVRHQLAEQINAAKLLLAAHADIFGDDDQAKADAVEGETNLLEVIEIAARREFELDQSIDAVGMMMKTLKARVDRLENQKLLIREAIAVAMETANSRKIELPFATLSLQNKPASCIITSEQDIPADFWKPQDPKLDKKALLAALKAKQEIAGAELSNGGQTLAIRRA